MLYVALPHGSVGWSSVCDLGIYGHTKLLDMCYLVNPEDTLSAHLIRFTLLSKECVKHQLVITG